MGDKKSLDMCRTMYSGRRFSLALALLAGTSLAGCNLPDPDHKGREHEVDTSQLSQREFLAWHFKKVARNAERGKNYDASYMFYSRARDLNPREFNVLLGLGRSLLALNQPLEASEAFGAAIAIDEHNKEAVAGMSKSLDQVAVLSRRTPASDMPPLPAVAATENEPAPDMANAGDDTAAATQDKGAGDQGATPVEAAAAAATTGDTPKSGMNDVLQAVEWAAQDKPAEEGASTDMASAGQSATRTVSVGAPIFKIQLAAYGSAASAESARTRMASKTSDLLGGVQLAVEKSAASGGRKPMYRLFVKPFEDRPSAAAVCAKLKQRSISCFLVKARATAKWSVKAEPPAAKMANTSVEPPPAKMAPTEAPLSGAKIESPPSTMPAEAPSSEKAPLSSTTTEPTPLDGAQTGGRESGDKEKDESVLRWNNVVTSFKKTDEQGKMGAEETADPSPPPAEMATPSAPPPEVEKAPEPEERDVYNEVSPGDSVSD